METPAPEKSVGDPAQPEPETPRSGRGLVKTRDRRGGAGRIREVVGHRKRVAQAREQVRVDLDKHPDREPDLVIMAREVGRIALLELHLLLGPPKIEARSQRNAVGEERAREPQSPLAGLDVDGGDLGRVGEAVRHPLARSDDVAQAQGPRKERRRDPEAPEVDRVFAVLHLPSLMLLLVKFSSASSMSMGEFPDGLSRDERNASGKPTVVPAIPTVRTSPATAVLSPL